MINYPAKLKIRVRPIDIQLGLRHQPDRCPMARALNKAIAKSVPDLGSYQPHNTANRTTFSVDRYSVMYQPTTKRGKAILRKFVEMFDAGGTVKETRLTLKRIL